MDDFIAGSKPGWHEVEMEGSEVRCLWNQWDFIILENAVLYKTAIIDGQKTTFKQLLAPACIRRKIFEFLHSHRTGRHAGAGRTLKNVQTRFWWPNMRGDVELWCTKCDPCLFCKTLPNKRAPLKQSPVGSPMERIAIDILSLPTVTDDGNSCILVVCDYLTK